jgi:hypothetical protein
MTGVVRTLMHRASSIPSTDAEKVKEVIPKVIQVNDVSE